MYLRQKMNLERSYDKIRLSKLQTEQEDAKKYDEIIQTASKAIMNKTDKLKLILKNFIQSENKMQNQNKLFAPYKFLNGSEIDNAAKLINAAHHENAKQLYNEILLNFDPSELVSLNAISNRLKRDNKFFLILILNKVKEILNIYQKIGDNTQLPNELIHLTGSYL